MNIINIVIELVLISMDNIQFQEKIKVMIFLLNIKVSTITEIWGKVEMLNQKS